MTFKCEEYWLSIGILCVNQRSSIIQLFLQSEFVLLNQVVLVVLDTSKGKDAVLDVVTHLHLVDVNSFLLILLDILFFNELI